MLVVRPANECRAATAAFHDDDPSSVFWAKVIGDSFGFPQEAAKINEQLTEEFGLCTVGSLKQDWVTVHLIQSVIVKNTRSATYPEGRLGWMRSIQYFLQHTFASIAPGAPASAADAESRPSTLTKVAAFAPRDGIKLGDKLKVEGTLSQITLPAILDTMEYETLNPFEDDLTPNDTKEISKQVYLFRAVAFNNVSGDKDVENTLAKLLKKKYKGKPAFSGDWRGILKRRAQQGRRATSQVLSRPPVIGTTDDH